jgi:hypothetical protein
MPDAYYGRGQRHDRHMSGERRALYMYGCGSYTTVRGNSD